MTELLLVGACSDNVDIQQSYPFSIEIMPVPKKLKVGETAEIRGQLHRDGRYEETKYFIRYSQPDGAGTLKMSDGTVLLPNDLYPLSGETFRLFRIKYMSKQKEPFLPFTNKMVEMVLYMLELLFQYVFRFYPRYFIYSIK